MLDLGGNLVVYHRLLVLANDIDAELEVVGRHELVGLRLSILL